MIGDFLAFRATPCGPGPLHHCCELTDGARIATGWLLAQNRTCRWRRSGELDTAGTLGHIERDHGAVHADEARRIRGNGEPERTGAEGACDDRRPLSVIGRGHDSNDLSIGMEGDATARRGSAAYDGNAFGVDSREFDPQRTVRGRNARIS
jgi:hypothetical protein